MKRVAITGDRDWEDYDAIYQPLSQLPAGSFIVLGDCPTGADKLAKRACLALLREEGRVLIIVVKEANWKRYHGGAGPKRNGAMLDELELGAPEDQREVWWFHDDLTKSKGTRNCVGQARDRGLPLFERGLVRNDASEAFAMIQLRLPAGGEIAIKGEVPR